MAQPVNPVGGDNNTKNLLKLEHVSKTFSRKGNDVEVLRDINLEIKAGEFVSVLGASGCGKTTLARIVDGLETADAGTITLGEGQSGKRKAGTDSVGGGHGFVFQKDNLFPWRTIIDNVSLGLELRGVPKKERREQARGLMELVGLSGFEGHYPHELSGGMKQRANLARAFCVDPDLFIMDEPFAALDAQTREIMQTELLRIWRSRPDTGVMFITHQIDEAVFLSDRIVVLTARPGQIKEIIDVPFPRPRPLDIKRSADFGALYDKIWKYIEEEVRAAMQQ